MQVSHREPGLWFEITQPGDEQGHGIGIHQDHVRAQHRITDKLSSQFFNGLSVGFFHQVMHKPEAHWQIAAVVGVLFLEQFVLGDFGGQLPIAVVLHLLF